MDIFDVVVIGGGPGGYVAAIRAGELGFKTACIDDGSNKEGKPSLGGTCLNVGCIPSKALLDTSERYEQIQHDLGDHGISVTGASIDVTKMLARKESVVAKLSGGIAGMFRKAKVTSFHSLGRLVRKDGDHWVIAVGDQEIGAKNVIVATGSSPRALPIAPFDGDKIVENAGALSFSEVPKKLGVIGAGVIGLELGSVWRRLGAQVTILEAAPAFLAAADAQVAKEALKQFTSQGLDMHLGVSIDKVDASGNGVKVSYTENGEQKTLECDKLIVSIGRVPNTKGLGAEAVGLKLDERGFVATQEYRTNLDGIYAIGDVIGGAMLAHKAESEAVALVERLAGQAGSVNYDAIPWVIYTSPEIAWVGKTEEQLKAEGAAYKKGSYQFAFNGRALGHNDTRGFIKVIADAKTDKVLGVHMIGPNVSELLAEAVSVMEFGGSAEDIARTMHAHPTLSEVLKEAAHAVR
ncbi:dihydrolipoyl dehydrogenase [bacterium]|nr:dihydrolipoyl dehydrogenase [bacterium]